MAILCILYFSGGSRYAWEERSMAKIFLIWGSDTWMEGRWQTCNTLGVWLLKESRDLLCLHPHSWEVSSWRRNPRTQIKIPSWSQALYFLSLSFPLYSFSPSLDRICARAQGINGGRLGGGGRPGRGWAAASQAAEDGDGRSGWMCEWVFPLSFPQICIF